MSKELTPDFSYSFKAPVWKTCPDPEKHILALEIRDNDAHRVSFSIINMDEKLVILNDLVFDETWWISLAAIRDPVLFTRIFPDEQDPGKSSLQAYDFRKDAVLWTIAGLIPLEIGMQEITGHIQQGEDRSDCTVEIATGKITFPDREPGNKKDNGEQVPGADHLLYPVQYHEGDEGFRTLLEYLSRLGREPALAIDYLEFGKYIIINYYQRSGNEMVNFLLVLDQEGNILYHEPAGSGKGIARDTFFIMEKDLVFMKDRQNISVILLT